MDFIEEAKRKFGLLIEEQLKRVDSMRESGDFVDYEKLSKIIVGVVGGDGIGPAITGQAKKIMEYLLQDEIKNQKLEIREIEGLTIENRIKEQKTIPDDVLAELKECHVILKGPTTTPRAGDGSVNIESANVGMRKELDLFANVRPVFVEDEGIDWTFFRENTEGAYALGSKGVKVNKDLMVDFTITTSYGEDRIIRAAFEFARKNNKSKVTAVTKANIIKLTDGSFLQRFYEIAKEYPEIQVDDWYIDIMTAKLIDEKRRKDFKVFVLPNLYGDILTDEAAEFQGGVGTAGSANIGKKYAMFEAIHGSAPRMIDEKREMYADPCSIIRAASMLLSHIGYQKESEILDEALNICTVTEKKLVITGRNDGATSQQLSDYLIETISKIRK